MGTLPTAWVAKKAQDWGWGGAWRKGRGTDSPTLSPLSHLPTFYHPPAKPDSRPCSRPLGGLPQAAQAWNLSSSFVQISESYFLLILEALKMGAMSTTLGWILIKIGSEFIAKR